MTTDETVLITGGTGFIGAYVARELLARGHAVVAYDLATGETVLDRLEVADDVTRRRGDVSDPAELVRAAYRTGATRIVHLAALLGEASREPRRALEVNVRGATSVLEAARTLDPIERVVLASSETVYAPESAYGGGPVAEDVPVEPDTLYSAAKWYAERQAAVYREEYGVSTLALRPTGVYGPFAERGEALFEELLAKPARGEDARVEDGDSRWSWLYVRDAARAFVEAALAPESSLSRRVYNVPGPVATVREVAAVVESVAGVEVAVGDGEETLSAQHLDGSAAREDLGYEPAYDVPRGVEAFVEAVRR